MKILAFTDLHIHNYKNFNDGAYNRLNNTLKVLKRVFNTADANHIECILFSGDLFNNMQVMYTVDQYYTLKTFKELFEKYPNIHMYAISGNHDHAFINTLDNPAINSLMQFDLIFDNFHLIDDTVQMVELSDGTSIVIYGIPYYEYPDQFFSVLKERTDKYEPGEIDILLMHQMMGMNGNIVQDHISPDHPIFKNFSLVLNGHIHEHSQLAPTVYNVGTPLHRDAGDIGHKKGFMIIDSVTKEVGFIDITDKYPQYIQKYADEELTEWEADQYVITTPRPFEVEGEDEQQIKANFQVGRDHEEMLTSFVETVKIPIDLSKNELLDYIKNFKNEAQTDIH